SSACLVEQTSDKCQREDLLLPSRRAAYCFTGSSDVLGQPEMEAIVELGAVVLDGDSCPDLLQALCEIASQLLVPKLADAHERLRDILYRLEPTLCQLPRCVDLFKVPNLAIFLLDFALQVCGPILELPLFDLRASQIVFDLSPPCLQLHRVFAEV